MENPIILKTPLSEGDVRGLRVGNRILLSGTIYTARDQVHKVLFEKRPADLKILPFRSILSIYSELLSGGALYHCGPIISNNKIVSAGPTTSIRLEPYEADIIKNYKIRAIIGKGGMGENTLSALKENGAVYLAATGGAGALLADSIKKIKSVRFEEFGMAEAMWEFEVKDFPAIVAMDSNGGSLYKEVLKNSVNNLHKFY